MDRQLDAAEQNLAEARRHRDLFAPDRPGPQRNVEWWEAEVARLGRQLRDRLADQGADDG